MVHFIEDSKLIEMLPGLETDELTKINDGITAAIQEHCNTTFEIVTYTDEKYDSSYEVVPDHRPINSVTSLTDGGTALLEDTSFYSYQDKIILPAPSGTRKGLKISYKAGYSVIPEIVKSVALELLRFRIFKDTEGNFLFYKTQTVEEREYEVDPELTEEKILSQLSKYCQPVSKGKTRKPLKVGYIL